MSVAEITDKRGAELAWHVFDFIEQNPEHHNQNLWIALSPEHLVQLDEDEWFPITADAVLEHCGTTACFAGWTSLLIGRRLDKFNAVSVREGMPERIADPAHLPWTGQHR